MRTDKRQGRAWQTHCAMRLAWPYWRWSIQVRRTSGNTGSDGTPIQPTGLIRSAALAPMVNSTARRDSV